MKDTDLTKASSLQKKILIMSAVCVMLAICIISSNISRYSEDRNSVYNGILILSLIIMIIWIVAFFGVIYTFQPFVYFAWIMWALVAFLWLFFISGCISPTRCPEGLWLIENESREGVPVTSTTDFYYHEYHLPFPDKKPNKKDAERDMKTFDEISYVVDYVPLIKFNGLYTPWSSSMGAFIYLISFSLVFIFFMLTLVSLWRYSREIDSQQMSLDSQSTGHWKCRLHDSRDWKTKKDGVGVLKQSPDLIQSAPDDFGASSGDDFVDQTVAHDSCHTPVVDHCVTATQSQEHGSQRLQQHVSRSREVYETPFQPQIPTVDGQTSNKQPGQLARIARYVFRRPANI